VWATRRLRGGMSRGEEGACRESSRRAERTTDKGRKGAV